MNIYTLIFFSIGWASAGLFLWTFSKQSLVVYKPVPFLSLMKELAVELVIICVLFFAARYFFHINTPLV